MRFAPLEADTDACLDGNFGGPASSCRLPREEIQLGRPAIDRALRFRELHDVVAVGIAERAGPALTAGVAGRLEPDGAAERAVIKVPAQGAAAVRRVPLVPHQGVGDDADAP